MRKTLTFLLLILGLLGLLYEYALHPVTRNYCEGYLGTKRRKAPAALLELMQQPDFLSNYTTNPRYRWMHKQIAGDLGAFSCFSSACLDEEMHRFGSRENIVVRIKVKQGRVYVHKPSTHLMKTRRTMHRSVLWILNIVKDLSRAGLMPDVDFLVCTQDFLHATGFHDHAAPIMVYSKNVANPIERDAVMIPDFESLDFVIHEAAAVIDKHNNVGDFPNKRPLILFRGGGLDASGFRKKVSAYAVGKTFIDAAIIEPHTRHLSMNKDQQLAYKYNLSIDGATATWSRMIWMLATNTLLLKHDSPRMQWYYEAIRPYVHYVPVADEVEKLPELYHWLEANQDKAMNMVAKGMQFARESLNAEAFYGYYALLFQAYAQRQNQTISITHDDVAYDVWGIV